MINSISDNAGGSNAKVVFSGDKNKVFGELYSEIVDILREHEYDISTFELWNGKKVDNT